MVSEIAKMVTSETIYKYTDNKVGFELLFPSQDTVSKLKKRYNVNSGEVHVSLVLKEILGQKYILITFYSPTILRTEYEYFRIVVGEPLNDYSKKSLFEILQGGRLSIDYTEFSDFQYIIQSVYPNWNLRFYDNLELADFIKNIYYVSYHSGMEEILYKAQLTRIAKRLNEIDEVNLIGSNPTEILGVPLRLLRCLEDVCSDSELLQLLGTEKDRNYLNWLYQKYTGYFSARIRSIYQIYYLMQLEEFCLGREAKVDKALFWMMGDVQRQQMFEHIKFIEQAKYHLTEIWPDRKIPYFKKMVRSWLCLENMVEMIKHKEFYQQKLLDNSKTGISFENAIYVVKPLDDLCSMLRGLHDWFRSSPQMILEICEGQLLASGIYSKQQGGEMVAVLMVLGGEIVNLRRVRNKAPKLEELYLAEEIAKKQELIYRPNILMDDFIIDELARSPEERRAYMEFLKRFQKNDNLADEEYLEYTYSFQSLIDHILRNDLKV